MYVNNGALSWLRRLFGGTQVTMDDLMAKYPDVIPYVAGYEHPRISPWMEEEQGYQDWLKNPNGPLPYKPVFGHGNHFSGDVDCNPYNPWPDSPYIDTSVDDDDPEYVDWAVKHREYLETAVDVCLSKLRSSDLMTKLTFICCSDTRTPYNGILFDIDWFSDPRLEAADFDGNDDFDKHDAVDVCAEAASRLIDEQPELLDSYPEFLRRMKTDPEFRAAAEATIGDVWQFNGFPD